MICPTCGREIPLTLTACWRCAAKPLGGSSPALAIVCPVCVAPIGVYCMKTNGDRQIIAHKKRSEAARAERRARGGL